MSEALTILSQVIGWLYFSVWSISFYPQIIINYKLKHVKGYSFNYGGLNWVGYLAYASYSIWGYVDPSIMPGEVEVQDLAYAIHAFVLMTVLIGQCAYYDDLLWRTDNWVIVSNIIFIIVGASCAIFQLAGAMPEHKDWNGCLALGYIKLTITLMKYSPQVYRNWKRQSTVGWSIENILLDITGGSLSILQIFVDGANDGNWDVFGGGGSFNIAKFVLGFISIFFDIIFLIQHYCLYRNRDENANNQQQIKLVDV